MTLIIRFVSNEEPDFALELKAAAINTFADLHNLIKKELNYNDALLASFFISNTRWEKLQEITLVDMGEGGCLMKNTQIRQFVNRKGQHLTYVFDYFTERCLLGTVLAVSAKDTISQPVKIKLSGRIPPQLAPDNDVFADDALFSGNEEEADAFAPDVLSDEEEGGDY